jgi:site-specific recombinase XerD
MPSAQAFRVPPRQHVAKMLRANLAEARRVWLESHKTPQEREKAETTTSLAYADGASRVADFYALRHSFISALVAGGIHPKTAQRLARRSTIGLTMDRYTHMQSTGLASALDVLPDLSQSARQVATGPIMRCWLTVIILPNPRCVS